MPKVGNFTRRRSLRRGGDLEASLAPQMPENLLFSANIRKIVLLKGRVTGADPTTGRVLTVDW